MGKIKVIVNGANGRMGQETVRALSANDKFELVGTGHRQTELTRLITDGKSDVVIDFTLPQSVFNNAVAIIQAGARPVIGTTGLTTAQIEQLSELCAEKQLGGVIVPNFCLGAVLMMKFAAQAAHYLPNVEIIEFHHDKKIDSPSGTALKTAEIIANAKHAKMLEPTQKESLAGCRGGKYQDIPIHAVRLPGFVASQAVIFGDTGETLTIRHDSVSREAYMPGVLMAAEKVMQLNSLVIGLDKLLS